MNLKIIFTFLLGVFHRASAFPENLTPLLTLNNVSRNVFIGDKKPLYVQVMKELDFGGVQRLAVAAKENLYLLDPDEISIFPDEQLLKYNEKFTWKSSSETKTLCFMKGQPEELCYNFLSIIHVTDDGNLLVCGTNSYSPQCSMIGVSIRGNEVILRNDGKTMSGRYISPFGPNQPRASVFTAGSLFSGTYQSIFGGSSAITRTMGETNSLRSDASRDVLQDAEFIKMTEDDKRVLIFFNEKETLPTGDARVVSQVAQVCKNDLGGGRILEGMFTTFVKSRLNCSYNGFYLNHLRDVTDPIVVGNQKVVFATFSTPDNSLPGSAVCAFHLSTIHSSLSGPFLVNEEPFEIAMKSDFPASKHPGSCGGEALDDADLVFLKNHPQLKKQTIGSLLLTNQGQRWTAVTADVPTGSDNVTVIYIGTKDGRLIRSLPPPDGKPLTSGVVISEMLVFDHEKCSNLKQHKSSQEDKQVKTILIRNDVILVAFKHCVVTLPLRMCSRYQCKTACLASSDPYCGWNGNSCVPFLRPNENIEQSLGQSSSVSDCSEESRIEENAESKGDEEIVNGGSSLGQGSDVDGRPESDVGIKSEPTGEYTLIALIIVALSTFAVTLVLITLIFCCYLRRKRNDNLKQKQFKEQHSMVVNSDDRSGSIKRRVMKTYCGLSFIFRKVATPLQSPDVRRGANPNNYSENPTKLFPTDPAGHKTRKTSRMNSLSSDTSRCDSIRFFPPSQPLLTSDVLQQEPTADETLPKHLSEQSTLPFKSTFQLKTNPAADSPSFSSSSQSSGTSVFPENGNGAAESGVLLTHSAKLRRRDMHVEQRTNDIMRESSSAIRDTENVLLNLQKVQKSENVSSTSRHIGLSPVRSRIESYDSGNGDSCRSSWKPDSEQTFMNFAPGNQRPSSLDMQKRMVGKRRRLQSEGSNPNDVNFENENLSSRQRRSSGNHSNSSHCGTPVEEQFYMKTPPKKTVMYGTWSKGDMRINEKEKEFRRLHELAKKQNPHHWNQPYPGSGSQQFPFYPPSQALPASTDYNPAINYHQRMQPHPNRTSVDSPPLFLNSKSSPSKQQAVNYYPSLQVRGPFAQKPLNIPQCPVTKTSRRNGSPPLTYCSSINSQSHLQSSFSTLDKKGLPRNREKPPPCLVRHASMPASAKPTVTVAPMRIPHGGVV